MQFKRGEFDDVVQQCCGSGRLCQSRCQHHTHRVPINTHFDDDNHNHNIKLYSFVYIVCLPFCVCVLGHKYENQSLAVVFAYRDLEVSRDL